MTATVLLVHGAFCGDWVFWRLAPALEKRGVPCLGTNLPSCAATDTSIGTPEDAAYVADLIADIPGPVVVVGKSYGGAVISGACVGQSNVSHLVYVAASMPEAGEPFHRTLGAATLPDFSAGVSRLDDGRLEMDLDVGARCAFTQASAEDQNVWRREARPMSPGTDPLLSFDRVAWEATPSTYVVCEEDRAIDPRVQADWARRATYSISRPFDHSPGVSQPEAIADLLSEIARLGSPADKDARVGR